MRNTIVCGALGVIGGALMVLSTHSIWHHISRQSLVEQTVAPPASILAPSTSPSDSELTASTSVENAKATSVRSPTTMADRSKEPGVDQTFPAMSEEATVDSMGRELPEAYAAMVKPNPVPKKLTVQEMYKKFSKDARDEAWAYPMELGINQYMAERGNEFGVAFDFVECQSRHCTIAGVVYGGGQPEVNEFMTEMTQRGWWQTSGENHTVAFSTGDEYRFVSIFPRTPDDASRSESSGRAIEKRQQGATMSVGG